VLVLPGLTSTTRARLVATRVPFIVPANQLFLPMLLIDLRERIKRTVVPRESTLSSIAQLVVLAHLQGRRMDVLSLAAAAGLLGYSPMMLTKAKDELVAGGLCVARTEGRALRLSFAAEGRALWEKALPRLSSPVARTHFVRFPARQRGPAARAGFVRAGLSALSDLTNLADDPRVTYASSKRAAADAGSTVQRVELEEDASARLEVWRYSPELLSTDGRVDALSLYLSLRDTADERIQGALSDLLETVPW